MTDTDIRYALERATEQLEPPPDLLDRVRTGGHRRVVRRRVVLAGGLAAAAAGVTVPLLGRPGGDDSPPATRGDLAGDREFLSRVLRLWRRGTDSFNLIGDAYVFWAGSTPAGPMAIVRQAVRLPAGQEMSGFAQTVGGTLRFESWVQLAPAGASETAAVLAGPDRDVLVIDDNSRTLSFSEDYRIDSSGRVVRDFTPLVPRRDGVHVLRVPAQAGNVRIALRQRGPEEKVPLVNAAEAAEQTSAENIMPERVDRRLPGSERAWPADSALSRTEASRWTVTGRAGYDDPFGYHVWAGPSAWYLRGATPDGRRFALQTLVLDGRSRLFLFLGRPADTPAPHYLGLLGAANTTELHDESAGPLVVMHVRMPQKQGVVVAALNAALRYRVGPGAWLPAAGDAALLPDKATEVEVRPRRGQTVTIDIS